jgi:hypothetical protein
MSFVITEPEMVQGAAQNLASIRSSLAEATSTAAGRTTGIAAAAQDEVSVAISSLFGNFGQQFHALNAQAQAFHAQFESLLSSGASAYVSAEAANAERVLTSGGAGALMSGQFQTGAQAAAQSGLIGGIESFGATVAAPYQALVSNTVNNLQAIGNTFSANPFPLLHQFGTNQLAYGQTIATGLESVAQNIPAALANIPANIQIAIQGASTFNPGVLLQQFISQQSGYAQTISTALQSAGPDLITSLQGLPSAFGTAFQDLVMGNPVGAYHALNTGLVNAILPGFHDVNLDLGLPPSLLPIVPLGALGDLAPIFGIPGQMAQNFTNLLPAGSIPAQISQNFTNLLSTVTNFGSTLNGGNLGIVFGLPLQAIFDGIGAPINALSALNSSAVAFGGALQTGNASAAALALLDAPANMANGLLNGQTLVDLPTLNVNLLLDGVPLGSLASTAALPVGGLLTPLSPIILTGPGGSPLPGTQIGGFIPGLLSFGSELAAAITPLG